MPQLIAMVIVVVGAMIYMFQTFGGTGDKIEGIAQKTSVITEVNNIKNGLKLAAKARHIGVPGGAAVAGDASATLEGLAELAYFPEQINEQLDQDPAVDADVVNVYNAISFGGNDGVATVVGNTNTSALKMQLVNSTASMTPGIFIDMTDGTLADNGGFLEAQIALDLQSVATIDRTATTATAGNARPGATGFIARIPADNGEAGTNTDGMFIIYFNDFSATEIVRP